MRGNLSEFVSYASTSYLASFIIAYGSEYVSSAFGPGLSVYGWSLTVVKVFAFLGCCTA